MEHTKSYTNVWCIASFWCKKQCSNQLRLKNSCITDCQCIEYWVRWKHEQMPIYSITWRLEKSLKQIMKSEIWRKSSKSSKTSFKNGTNFSQRTRIKKEFHNQLLTSKTSHYLHLLWNEQTHLFNDRDMKFHENLLLKNMSMNKIEKVYKTFNFKSKNIWGVLRRVM